MLRFRIPGVIAIGTIVVAGWLIIKSTANKLPVGASLPSPAAISASGPDSDALAMLQATIAGLLRRLEVLEEEQNVAPLVSTPPQSGADQSVVEVPATTIPKTVFQTQVLYLGAGNTTERDWTETGVQTWLNSADYPSSIKATFEAGLSIIGGEAWARLKNKTTGAIISASEVFHNNSLVVWKGSGSFKLHPGNNLYVVEIKSTSGETANLTGSRLQLSQ